MSLRITLAQTPALLDSIYKVRHQVFSEEEEKFKPSHDGRVVDRYDAYPTTANLAVLDNDKVVGALRITADSVAGLPADESFDFRRYIPQGARLYSCGMYCVLREYRSPRVALGLNMMASYLGISEGADYAVAPINPAIARLLKRVGFQQLGEEFVDPHFGLPVLPMLLDLTKLNDHFVTFVQQNEHHNFLDSYECHIFAPGEPVIRAGDQGDMAYVIVEGSVEIRAGNGKQIATLSEGDVFGELALFCDDIRSADVLALTDVKAMALHKDVYMRYLHDHPEHAFKLINTLGQRIKTLYEKLI